MNALMRSEYGLNMVGNDPAGAGQGRQSTRGINMGKPGEGRYREDVPISSEKVIWREGLAEAPHLGS